MKQYITYHICFSIIQDIKTYAISILFSIIEILLQISTLYLKTLKLFKSKPIINISYIYKFYVVLCYVLRVSYGKLLAYMHSAFIFN